MKQIMVNGEYQIVNESYVELFELQKEVERLKRELVFVNSVVEYQAEQIKTLKNNKEVLNED